MEPPAPRNEVYLRVPLLVLLNVILISTMTTTQRGIHQVCQAMGYVCMYVSLSEDRLSVARESPSIQKYFSFSCILTPCRHCEGTWAALARERHVHGDRYVKNVGSPPPSSGRFSHEVCAVSPGWRPRPSGDMLCTRAPGRANYTERSGGGVSRVIGVFMVQMLL